MVVAISRVVFTGRYLLDFGLFWGMGGVASLGCSLPVGCAICAGGVVVGVRGFGFMYVSELCIGGRGFFRLGRQCSWCALFVCGLSLRGVKVLLGSYYDFIRGHYV